MLSTWLRGIGGALELIAVVLVVWEIRQAQEGLPKGAPGLWERLWSWLVRRKPKSVSATAHPASIAVTASALQPQVWNDTWGVDQKIGEVLRRIERLQQKTAGLDQQIREQADRHRRELAKQLAEVRTELGRLKAQTSDATRRSSRIRGYGLIPLVLGIVLTTWPTEIAGWFGGS